MRNEQAINSNDLQMMYAPALWRGYRQCFPKQEHPEIDKCVDSFVANLDRACAGPLVLFWVAGFAADFTPHILPLMQSQKPPIANVPETADAPREETNVDFGKLTREQAREMFRKRFPGFRPEENDYGLL